MTVEIHPDAAVDLDQISDRIAADNPPAAKRFLRSFGKTREMIGMFPTIGNRLRPRDAARAGLRSIPVRHYPTFLVFWILPGDRVVIVRVLHGAQDVDQLMGPPVDP